MTGLILAVGIVLFTSAMCSLFEAVLYSVPLSHVESLAQEGRAGGVHLRRLRANVDRPITAILTLNTIANTGGATVAGAIADRVLDADWLVFFSVVFTLAILMFSEIGPKTAGVVYSRPLSGLIAGPLQLLVWIFQPVIWLSRSITAVISRGHREEQVSQEELIMMARLGRRSGEIKADEAQVIQNILSLRSKTARNIMTPRTVVFTLRADTPVEEARKHKEILSYSRIPVHDKDFDDVIGIVHSRDIQSASADNRRSMTVGELIRPVQFVLDSIELDRLLRMFLEQRQHLFVVLDEFSGMSGVLTLEDVLEEILGKEIVDEFDQVTDMRELARRRRREAMLGKKE